MFNITKKSIEWGGETLTLEQALSGAPEHDGSRFQVSAILGEEQ